MSSRDRNTIAFVRRSERRFAWGLVVALLAPLLGCSRSERDPPPEADPARVVEADPVREVVASEELMLSLTPRLRHLTHSMFNLKLPDWQGKRLFADRIQVVDLHGSQPPRPGREFPSLATRSRTWAVSKSAEQHELATLDLWRPLLKQVDYFKHAKFYFVRGSVDAAMSTFQSDVGFEGLARGTSGGWLGVQAKIKIRWQRDEKETPADRPSWRIDQWRLQELTTRESDRLFFSDVLRRALPRASDRRRATVSRHREILLESYFGGKAARYPKGIHDSRFFPDSNALHPGLAVVDVDGDGHDDLYITVRWGKNMLLRNQGDGTFIEEAARWGLDIEGRSNAALFADFDNDGDVDLMLGRSLEPSMYLVNEGGRFVDRSKSLVSTPLPHLVTSVSAADYNGDGLLDVYLSTYTPIVFNERIIGDRSQALSVANDHLQGQALIEFQGRYAKDHHRLFDEVGPPNVLLINRGGHFELAPENDSLAVWRNTFQATWADYDSDGDADLYVANDFAPDHLFRNDGADGFTDVTEASGANVMGFAMGASWGDYDNDGRQDLYVSNMYSKAGKRIIGQLAGLDARFAQMVEGNYLYRAGEQGFRLVSGLKQPKLTVARAGWAWGGQWADLDNDGYLDLYVSSGYYSVPEAFSTDVDL
ncbi:MAG: VCBS repeat-containing protein [Planctomycetes bacterium]|nr:VCBS repeat-containing protein [Planctomycetota bacterium]